MEKKTIGQFIAALRKASGMTQKQLSEKLNVSDKAVSRWERDECAPDLSLIPVIAEIFGVTSDEILRGERKFEQDSFSESPVTSAKSTKQMEHILNDAKLKFSIRSIISVGIAVAGLLGAMLCNFGFNRAYIGFIVACIFYLAAAVCETIFVKLAFSSVSGEDFESDKTELCKKNFFEKALSTYFVISVLLAVSLPLIICVNDSHFGLTAESWLDFGLAYGVCALLVCALIKVFSERFAIKNGVYILSEKEKEHSDKVYRFDKKCLTVLACTVCFTLVLQLLFSCFASVELFCDGKIFDSVESFVEYMETPEQNDGQYYDSEGIYINSEPVQDYYFSQNGEPVDTVTENVDPNELFNYNDVHYFDQYGNEISEEEALTREFYGPDGKVVATYIERNRNVAQYNVDWDGDKPTITVYTHDDISRFYAIGNDFNAIFAVIYGIEIILICAVWFIKRRRIK